MPRTAQITPSLVTLRLQVSGPQTAQALAAEARVNRSNVSRVLARMGDTIVPLGVTRGMRYALRRAVRGLGDTFPIRRIDAEGRAHDWAELTALHGGWRVNWADPARAPAWSSEVLGLGGFSEGFPFFLSELRPQGFLGRAVARALPPALGLAPDPRAWPSDDDTLVYLLAEGEDVPGDLVVGDQSLRRLQQRQLAPPVTLLDAARGVRYPELAASVAAAGVPGSSVEGEQPKFLVTLAADGAGASAGGSTVIRAGVGAAVAGEGAPPAAAAPTPVLVKFTDVLTTPTGRRWADLLVAEAHALALLHAQGEAHAAPRLLDAGGRRFLETPRYDRVGAHGRRGVISLRALHDAFDGPDANAWPAAAARLHARDLIDADALRSIRLRHALGRLIGNTDMHFGNLAFWWDDTLPFRLAPAYDMLPMLWAPQPGQATPAPEFAPELPLPAERETWLVAAAWAVELWARVAADARVSPEFAAIAMTAGERVQRMRAWV